KEEDCIGCTICAKKCPVEAIEGEVKKPHKIVEEKCIKCGICLDVCPKDAIVPKKE
ncbi:MAG: 4Fe-4S binding protein, partial [Candidatus Cloacimonetes bacterium]|nr:4Fe-4S binding protein [Candidatus Cloacimonadota bacterium]